MPAGERDKMGRQFETLLRADDPVAQKTRSRVNLDSQAEVLMPEHAASWQVTGPKKDLRDLLLAPPYLDGEATSVLDEVEAERKLELPREIDLEVDE